MDFYNLFLDICLLLCGIRGFRIRRDTLKLGYPPENSILCPRNFSVKNHPNRENYCREVCPKLLFLSAVMVVCGAGNLLTETLLPDFSQPVGLVTILLFLASIVWFGLSLSRAQKLYFRL